MKITIGVSNLLSPSRYKKIFPGQFLQCFLGKYRYLYDLLDILAEVVDPLCACRVERQAVGTPGVPDALIQAPLNFMNCGRSNLGPLTRDFFMNNVLY